jgi:glycosyltransferase involved in cell wall biosynthesis
LVHEGKTGVLFQAGDVVHLAAAISFLIERPELAAQMGAAGRALVASQHSPDSHYRAMAHLYEQ